MNGWKKALQALTGLILAGCAALAAGTWVFPEERDLILSKAGLRLSVTGAGAGLSLLTLLLFLNGWLRAMRQRDSENPEEAEAGRFWNGLGFGFLPAVTVWKVFEARTLLGRGTPLPEGFGGLPGLTSGGLWLPARAELILSLALFAAVILWLMLRRQPLPENGDLAGVSLTIWGAARLMTEGFRAAQIELLGPDRIVGWLAAGAMAAVLAWWTVRTFRQRKNTGYAFACLPVFVVSVIALVLIRNEVFLTRIPAADLILQAVCALLAMKAVLCMGRVSRQP